MQNATLGHYYHLVNGGVRPFPCLGGDSRQVFEFKGLKLQSIPKCEFGVFCMQNGVFCTSEDPKSI